MTALTTFLTSLTPSMEETETWNNGLLPLRITSYLTDLLPPIEYITSVRAIVFQQEYVLTVGNSERLMILPGGRLEENETLEQALHREVLEETGWTLRHERLIGFMHFHHLSEKPEGYRYPHPDFLQTVYVATAGEFKPELLASEYAIHGFRAIAEVQAMPLHASERLFLTNALAASES